MNVDVAATTYVRLRDLPVWRLLAASNAPTTIALLQVRLLEDEHSLPASVLHERIEHDLEILRAEGHDLPQTAKAYVTEWLADGYACDVVAACRAQKQRSPASEGRSESIAPSLRRCTASTRSMRCTCCGLGSKESSY